VNAAVYGPGVAHKRIGPDAPHQALCGDDLAGVLGKTDQHLHHLGFQANGARRSGHAVQRWLNMVGLADAEGVLQAARGSTSRPISWTSKACSSSPSSKV
jgi:hypothetical protein